MRSTATVSRQLKIGRLIALNQFLNHIALVSSHYGTSARVPERGVAFGHCLCGSAVSSAEQTTQTSSRLGAFESTKNGVTLVSPPRVICIGRSI